MKGTIDHVQVKDLGVGGSGLPRHGDLSLRNSPVLVRNSVVAFATSNGLLASGGGKLNIEKLPGGQTTRGHSVAAGPARGESLEHDNHCQHQGWFISPQAGFETYGNNKSVAKH